MGQRRPQERLLPVLARHAAARSHRRHCRPGLAPRSRQAVRHARAVAACHAGAVAGGGDGRAHGGDRALRGLRALSRVLHALGRSPPLAHGGAHLHRHSRRDVSGLRAVVPGADAQRSARDLARLLMGLENLLLGFSIAVTPFNLLVAVLGITLGTVIGVLPGLGGANGVAILLPLTFTMPPTSAIISVLFNIPGEPWSVATTFDGYPMARQGQGGQALTAAFSSSFIGALFSIVLITFFAPLLAEIALKFGPPEFFAIQFLTFSSFVGLGGGNPLKSLV